MIQPRTVGAAGRGRPQAATGSATASEPGPTVEARGQRILIVEDNYFVGLTIEVALLGDGYDVLGIAESGEEAIERARAETPDLVLMDIRLAGDIDGIDAAIRLREFGIRCVIASAHSDRAMQQRAAPAQPVAWLVKPFSDADLLATVRDALQQRN